MVGLLEALGETRCTVVGHDEGSLVASAFAVFRPDLVRGVALLSVPYIPRGDVDQLTAFTELNGPNNYQAFFQEPGVAEATLEADTRVSVRSILIGASGDAPEVNTLGGVGNGVLFAGTEDAPLPDWLTNEDLEYFTAEFERTGYRGGLNWYRNSVLNWELMAAWHKAPLLAPSLYLSGDRDLVYNWPGMTKLVAKLRRFSMPNLSKTVVLEGCGHWTQQERPSEINELLLDFLAGLDV